MFSPPVLQHPLRNRPNVTKIVVVGIYSVEGFVKRGKKVDIAKSLLLPNLTKTI